jgi:hypothetical protein
MTDISTKSILAKLLATENLHVEQRAVKTASFDVLNRILTIPLLDDNISNNLYDLFIAHEVSHALYTPIDGLVVVKERKIPHIIANLVEDVRIEKMIQDKYPGLRTSFFQGYKELVEKNFFGTKGKNLNELNFLDRINLHYKLGVTLNIQFLPEEQQFLPVIEACTTFDDVVEIADQIACYLRAKKEKEKSDDSDSDFDESDGSDDSDSDFDESDGSDDSDFDESDESDGSDDSTSDSGGSDGSDSDEEYDTEDDGYIDESEDEDFRSFTDENFKQKESELFRSGPAETTYLNIPQVNIKNVLVDFKRIMRELPYACSGNDINNFIKLKQELNPVVSYLAKEFELRKNAAQMKRAATSNTGDLNMSKIFSYRFNEDIFKKMTVVPNGKSHGLVIFIDWSGSMCKHMMFTLKQLLTVVMFCKKVSIPYEVYAFSSTNFNSYTEANWHSVPVSEKLQFSQNSGDMGTRQLSLLNLLSSRMSTHEFTEMSAFLWGSTSYRSAALPAWLRLSSTPLNESIISAMDIIPQFKKQYRLDIVNSVFLTDGEADPCRGHYEYDPDPQVQDVRYVPADYRAKRSPYGSNVKVRSIVVVRDPVTHNEERYEGSLYSGQMTTTLIKLLKRRTGANIVGFYILNSKDFKREFRYVNSYSQSAMQEWEATQDFNKNKFAIIKNAGFDEYYWIRSSAENHDDEKLKVEDNASTRKLVTAFAKYSNNKMTNRVVLNRFAQMIS